MTFAEKTINRISEEEYLETERKSEIKHEYFQGEVYAMAGASRAHNLIVANVIRELGVQLKKTPCKVYPSDLRIKISDTGLYTYPDVTVTCGEERFDDDQSDTLLNPEIIIEVLSTATESYDRIIKFGHYKKSSSLKDFILISQYDKKIEKYTRRDGRTWIYTETDDEHPVIKLESIGCTLSHEEVYDKVDLLPESQKKMPK